MSATLASLGIDKLPRDVQRSLYEELGEHLDGNVLTAPPPMSAAQLAELRRRIAEDDANPEEGIPWEDIKADLARRWGWK